MKLYAHRGYRKAFPENTIEAIAAVRSLPVAGVEFDVALTRDGIPMCIHQETLIPDASGQSLELATRNEASGWLAEMTAQAAGELDAGGWYSQSFVGVRIPRFESVLQAMEGYSGELLVELIDPSYFSDRHHDRDIVGHGQHSFPLLLQYPALHTSLLSFSPEILKRASREKVPAKRILNLWTEWNGRLDEAIACGLDCQAEVLHIADCMLEENAQWGEKVQQAGMELYVYELSPALGEAERSLMERHAFWSLCSQRGVLAITTDYPVEANAFFKSR